VSAMKTLLFLLITFLPTILGGCCSARGTAGLEDEPMITNELLVDRSATAETVALFRNLRALAGKGVMFGHQDATAYGVGWWAEPGRSDVKEVCGDYPAVYGWDLGDIHKDANLDRVDFNKMTSWIKEAYARGGVITLSMHLDNPVTGRNAWDNTPAVPSILPGNSHHEQYLATLDRIADFLGRLKTSTGIYIPVVLRPYHEHNMTWSWWGGDSCTPEEYNALWRMTVEHLRDKHELHNLLYAISPQDIETEADYLARYPGDGYVDILGLDCYRLNRRSSIPQLGRALGIIGSLAEQCGKVSALTEVGSNRIPQQDWWTGYLLEAVKYSEQSRKTAWALVWRNASKDHHYAPYPGHDSVPDFMKFYNDSMTLFEDDLPEMYR
jgi:mannan endo-1,4-beta-mannosidase